MQFFIHTTGKFLWWLTPELFKALVRLKFLPFVLGNILLKWKKKIENLYSKQHYFSKHHFTLLLTKISESSEIVQTLACSDESGNSCSTAVKLHCPSYREKGINARQHKNNVLIKTTEILWLYVCRAQNTAPRAGSDPLGSPLDWGGRSSSTAPQDAAAAVGTGADGIWLTGRWRELPKRHQHSTTSFHRNRCLARIISISFPCWDIM